MNKYCVTCGYVAEPKKYIKGSFIIELGLWFMFLLPGLIYSIWRLSSRYLGCVKCGSRTIIPMNSPVAKTAILRNAL